MRKLRLFVIVAAALWLVGEFAAIPFAESQIEKKVDERAQDVAGASADIDSFPLVTRLLLTGRVNEVSVTLDEVVRQRVTFADVRFELSGVQADRGSILSGKVRVTSIDRGTVTATIDVGRLGSVLGRVLSRVGLDVDLDGHTLQVGPASFELSSELFPCDPDARLEGEQVVISCTVNEVPEPLLEGLQS